MSIAWQDATRHEETLAFGPLTLVVPMLQQLGIADIINAHLPPDPQLRHAHGDVLSLLLAARLCQPTALVNISTWAEDTGADLLWQIPAADLNDDRLGRALDAFFDQRHAIQAQVAAQTLHLAELSPHRLHFDPTHIHFYGTYDSSQPRPESLSWPPNGSSVGIPPAHITHGYGAEEKVIQVGVTAVIDDLGAVPILICCIDGHQNGHTAIAQQCDWMREIGLMEPGTLLFSDRGTFFVEHVARLHRADCQVLCSVPWANYAALYQQHEPLTYRFDAVAAAAAAEADGISALLTTAARTTSADQLFTQFKEQNHLETSHHQWKTPLAVRPVFLRRRSGWKP
jgi:hypothetical protein